MKKYSLFSNYGNSVRKPPYSIQKSELPKKNNKKGWLILSSAVLSLLGGIYWYVEIAGMPQFDGPQQFLNQTKLSYKIVPYKSQVMGGDRTYGVSLPPNYAKNKKQRYPVIFLLHGGNGSPTDWFKKGAALPIIQKLYDQGKLPPSIIITPDGNDRRGASPFFDSEYVDGANGNVDTAIGDELVKVIQSQYRTLPTPAFWAIGGLSSGGWGALNIGLHHPDRFSTMFSHSGYFCFPRQFCKEKAYKNKIDQYNSPLFYVEKLAPQDRAKLRIYTDAGVGDGEFLSHTEKFHKTLNNNQVSNVSRKFPGGHVTVLVGPDATWNYWHKHLADSLTYVGKQFREASSVQAGKHTSTIENSSAKRHRSE